MPRQKIPYGLFGDKLVHVSEVDRGEDCGCRCVACNALLVARKGSIREHHFSHASNEAKCAEETVLHRLGKRLLRERIERHLKAVEPLLLEWYCTECDSSHEVNLLKKAAHVHEEYTLGTARADLMLESAQSKPYVAIEVVVTHTPEASVRQFYQRSKITCVEIVVKTVSDLERIKSQTPLRAKAVDFCSAPKCSCGGILFPRSISIVELPCWKCRKPMKASYGYFGFGPVPPSYFAVEEIVYASRCGVKIQKRFSSVVRRSYYMNICPHCDRPWGDNFAGTLWADFGAHPSKDVLHQCEKCNTTKALTPAC